MADTKISALPASTVPLAGTEVLPIVQSSTTKQVSVANLTLGLDTITAAKGGTGQTSYAVGDLLYASTTTALSKLADVATGNALISGGVGAAPSYGKIGLTTHVSGTLAVGNGGTGITTTPTNGQIPIGNGTNYVAATLTAGAGIGITNASGAVTVAVNTGPAFSASQSANQSIATATYTKIQFNTEDFDTNGNYDNATNYRFTPTVGGYYQINAQVRDATGAITGALFCLIYKNGTSYKQSIGPVATAGLSTNVSAIINFNGSSDYVEVYAYQNSGSAMLIGSGISTYFNGCMVRGT